MPSDSVDLVVRNGRIDGVITSDGDEYIGDAVVLATGHSARDIFAQWIPLLEQHESPVECQRRNAEDHQEACREHDQDLAARSGAARLLR